MPSGVVQAVGKSRTGKPTVTIDGQIYSASKVDTSKLVSGDKIEFESASSIYNGATVWFLNSFKVVQAALPAPSLPHVVAQNAAPMSSYGVQDAERPCVSNWGAELIKAGLIKDPADLGIWVTAIKNVLR
jgi:hypothetical protein